MRKKTGEKVEGLIGLENTGEAVKVISGPEEPKPSTNMLSSAKAEGNQDFYW